MEIYFITTNQNKVLEINNLLQNTGINVLSQNELGFNDEIEETGNTFEENAILKAQTVFNLYRKPMFAEDSGLEIKALNGEPGVRSARYSGENGSSSDNINLVLKKMKNIHDRRARFTTVIAYIKEDKIYTFKGIINGNITKETRGTSGFGYDPIFVPEGYDRTFAEFSQDEKNLISHRSQAVKKFIEFLRGGNN